MSRRSLVAAAVVAAAFACDRPPTDPAVSPAVSAAPPGAARTLGPSAAPRTPFQQSIMQAIADRQAQGLPVPAQVTYEYAEDTAAAAAAPQLRGAAAAPQRTVLARTILSFDNPDQAGLAQWPDIVVEGTVPPGATGYIRKGDYTQLAKEQIQAQYPDAWTTVSYEAGPRTYTFAESLAVTGPAASAMQVQLPGLSTITAGDELLMGFTVLGPNLDYSIGFDVDICVFWFFGCVAEVELVDFWAGFKLDWTIGTRLPLALSVNTPSTVFEGSTFQPLSTATGVDWSGPRFQQMGVSPEGGNEFILRFVFKVGVFLEVLGVDVIDLGKDLDLDRAASFATPLGPGLKLALPTIDISIWGFDAAVAAADIGVQLTPQAGSDRFTANWLAAAEGAGGGAVTYTTSGVPVALGSVTALDGPGAVAVQLDAFRYYFNQFSLDLGLYFYLSVLGYGGTWTIPITDFDLSGLTGGLYVPPHSGTIAALELAVPVANVAPTAIIDRAGTTPIQGVPTFFALPGQVLAFTGHAADPGRDDLTLTWDWNDGPPAPDVTTTYPVPHAVTETRAHAFAGACLYQVGLTAVDDDLAEGRDRVPVVVTGGAGFAARLEGYWQHQFGGMGHTDFDPAQLLCYLGIVERMSGVFGEQRALASLAQAHDILFLQQNAGDPRQQLDRELLVAWLNFAGGVVGLAEPVDLNGDGQAETPFAAGLAAVEAARLDPATSPQALRTLTRNLHRISLPVLF